MSRSSLLCARFVLPIAVVALGSSCNTTGENRMPDSALSGRRLDHLFDATLRYTSESPADAVIPPEGREGVYVGSGDGTVTGPRLSGRIRWSFYSAACMYLIARAGGEVPPGQHLCYANPGGFIETNDGVRIRFDAKGYGLRGFDASTPHRWRLTMALQFSTKDTRYAWLNTSLGIWEGEFDERTKTATYRAYLPAR
jgi:hypothetical protein